MNSLIASHKLRNWAGMLQSMDCSKRKQRRKDAVMKRVGKCMQGIWMVEDMKGMPVSSSRSGDWLWRQPSRTMSTSRLVEQYARSSSLIKRHLKRLVLNEPQIAKATN